MKRREFITLLGGIDREPLPVNSNRWKEKVRQWSNDCQTVVTFMSESRANRNST
jgi:hypothetical protein